jgi:hypothetical protein
MYILIFFSPKMSSLASKFYPQTRRSYLVLIQKCGECENVHICDFNFPYFGSNLREFRSKELRGRGRGWSGGIAFLTSEIKSRNYILVTTMQLCSDSELTMHIVLVMLLQNGGSCKACTLKRCIIFRCITQQSMKLNIVLT